jgi:hypothetical protein
LHFADEVYKIMQYVAGQAWSVNNGDHWILGWRGIRSGAVYAGKESIHK